MTAQEIRVWTLPRLLAAALLTLFTTTRALVLAMMPLKRDA
jgi:hypothetical protein